MCIIYAYPIWIGVIFLLTMFRQHENTKRAGVDMEIVVNGKENIIQENMSLGDFLTGKGFLPKKVVVEHNGTIIENKHWYEIILSPQDRLEIVTFVGGG